MNIFHNFVSILRVGGGGPGEPYVESRDTKVS